MKKLLIVAIVGALGVAAYAQAAAASGQKKARTPEQEAKYQRHMARRAARQKQIEAEGGLLRSNPAANVMRFTNAQKLIDRTVVSGVAESLMNIFAFPVEVSDVEMRSNNPLSVVFAGFAIPHTGAQVAIIESDAMPTLTVCPENSYTILNVRKLAVDNPSPDLLKLRVRKEIWRGAMMAVGVGSSQMQPCLMRPIHSLKDLDRLPHTESGPDSLNVAINGAEAVGITMIKKVTYKKACEEGWAPAPTNDIQKAIWSKVHEIPTKPIKIEYDPKKGE